MLKQCLYILAALSFTSCVDKNAKTKTVIKDGLASSQQDTSITNNFDYQIEQKYLNRKRLLSDRLALLDLEKGTTDFQLRIWYIPSMWDPSILYILKANDTTWNLYHYQFYTLTVTDPNHFWDNPLVDSVVMESVWPQKMSWQTYIKNLQLDSLWKLQTESSIKGKKFSVTDGHRCLLELSDKGKYKYLFYTMPEYKQDKDINHKKFVEFERHLVGPIIYKGMHNP
jgi:hypothetical protein